LTLSEWTYDSTTFEWDRTNVKAIRVDGKKVLPDTWYQLKDGKVVTVA
jgi:hypothetical protein